MKRMSSLKIDPWMSRAEFATISEQTNEVLFKVEEHEKSYANMMNLHGLGLSNFISSHFGRHMDSTLHP